MGGILIYVLSHRNLQKALALYRPARTCFFKYLIYTLDSVNLIYFKH